MHSGTVYQCGCLASRAKTAAPNVSLILNRTSDLPVPPAPISNMSSALDAQNVSTTVLHHATGVMRFLQVRPTARSRTCCFFCSRTLAIVRSPLRSRLTFLSVQVVMLTLSCKRHTHLGVISPATPPLKPVIPTLPTILPLMFCSSKDKRTYILRTRSCSINSDT